MAKKGQPAISYQHLESTRPEQARLRLRRGTIDPEVAREAMGGKPLDEWDLDELAKGQPRRADGTFRGVKPAWVTKEVQDEAWARFTEWVRGEASRGSIRAIARVSSLIDNAESDRVRLDASKFLLEYVLGKPTQKIEGNVGIDFRAMLAQVLLTPDGQTAVEEQEKYEELDWDEEEDLD